MADQSEVDRILSQYGQGYTSPALNSGDGEIVDTAGILGQYTRRNEGLPGVLRGWAGNVRDASRPDNVLAGGLDTAANWIAGEPQVGQDTLAPLGLGIMGSMLAPANAAGIFGGRLARTADREALSRAEEMAGRGVPRETIWDQTGWFQGVDGKWRFEIDDSTATYRPGALDARVREQSGRTTNEIRETGVQAPLYEVLEHPALYDAYSSLAMTPWQALPPSRMELPGYGGLWRGEREGMQINNEISPSLPRGRSITLHEAQHGIQDIEGFARGANRSQFQLSPEQLEGAQRQLAQVIDAQLIKREAAATGKTPAEIEFQFRHEFELNPQPGAHNWFHHPLDGLAVIERRLRSALDEARDPSGAYHRTAGEVEARNVQTRRDFSPEARRAIPPWRSQDVPDADQILRQYSQGPQMSTKGPDDVLRQYGPAPATKGGNNRRMSDLDAQRTYYRNRTWDSPEDARANIRRRIEEDNQRYGGLFGPPTDPNIVDQLQFVKKGNKVAISQRGLQHPERQRQQIELREEPEGSAPNVDWTARDLQDRGTPESVMQEFGRGRGEVRQGYISADLIPTPRGAGIRDGRPVEGGGFFWDEFQHRRGEGMPPAKIRLNRNGTISILDGNHRIAWWRDQGFDEIPVYVVDERGK